MGPRILFELSDQFKLTEVPENITLGDVSTCVVMKHARMFNNKAFTRNTEVRVNFTL